jgi:putative heme transporter
MSNVGKVSDNPDPRSDPDDDAAGGAETEAEPEAKTEAETESPSDDGRRWLGTSKVRSRGSDEERFAERLAHQFAQQWAQAREQRRPEPEKLRTGPSNFTRAQVPWGLDLAAAWSWRLIVIAAAGLGILWVLDYFLVITLPLAIALLLAALANPVVARMRRIGIPGAVAAMIAVVVGLGLIGLLLTFVGQQVADGAADLADSVVRGLGQIKSWLKDGPLNASDSQIEHYIEQTQKAITERSKDSGQVVDQVTEVGTALGHIFAGFFIVLFATYFLLADGPRIWQFFVRMAPRAARERVDSSGRVAWVSLTQFVRATVIVALVDAIGVVIVASILQVPFVLAIGVLVFLGAFIPMVGATIAGTVAVLVALVDQGPVTALLMLGGVILVQQIEGHVLQPFLMGRWVSVHPLGVIIAIACGVLVAGVPGALLAVPAAAVINAVCQHLSSYGDSDGDADERVEAELDGGGLDPTPDD